MIGRALVRFPLRARLLRPTIAPGQHDFSAQVPAVLALRSYATPGRPKKVVGEPSKPVKRAVKKAAASPKPGAAETAVKAKKTAAAKKTKKPAKKTLTEEQKAANAEKAARKKERAKLTKEKGDLAARKKAALDPPKLAKHNAFATFSAENPGGVTSVKGDISAVREALGNRARANAALWKNLNAAEIEHYNHLSNEKRKASEAEYKRWVESHTAEEIKEANIARAWLRKHGVKTQQYRKAQWPAIRDERAVKRPLNAFALFCLNRHASGDFRNIPLSDRSKLIATEWKALSEEEKRKYQNLQRQDMDRFVTESKDVYGVEPSLLYGNGRAEAVAAAA